MGVDLGAGVGGPDDGEGQHVRADVVGDVLALALPRDRELGGGEEPFDLGGGSVALLTLLTYPGIEGETFNIGAQHELDVLTITDTLLGLLGKPKTLIRHVEDRPGHDRRYAVDSSKLTRVTGWKPAISFADGIRQTVEWFQANEAWWRPIRTGEFREYYERMYGQRKVLKEVRS